MTTNRIKAVAAILAIVVSLPFFGRNWHRCMHLLGAVMFLGDILVTAVWVAVARKHRDAEVARVLVRGLFLTDALFLLPGVLLLLLNGGQLGVEWFKAGATWIMISVTLFVITGVVYGALLEPVQKKLARTVAATPAGSPLPPEYDALLAKWFRWGGIATLLPLVTFALMVFKPAF
jgi:uncharacterized membrane protein